MEDLARRFSPFSVPFEVRRQQLCVTAPRAKHISIYFVQDCFLQNTGLFDLRPDGKLEHEVQADVNLGLFICVSVMCSHNLCNRYIYVIILNLLEVVRHQPEN